MSYEIFKPSNGMAFLRGMFPTAEPDELNMVLFSTSGIHGHYFTIEECEAGEVEDVTFLVVHPRTVMLQYGNATPSSPDDFVFLKKLREASHACFAKIGIPAENSLSI